MRDGQHALNEKTASAKSGFYYGIRYVFRMWTSKRNYDKRKTS